MKEHFCNILGLLGIGINFKSNEDNKQHVEIVDCDVQWGARKGKNPYKYLRGSNPKMKARIEYLWPIVHQHPL